MSQSKKEIIVCCSTGCNSLGGQEIYEELRNLLQEYQLDIEIKVKPTGCHGFCQTGPRMVVNPDGVMYVRLKKADVRKIVEQHLRDGQIVEELCYKSPTTGLVVQKRDEVHFFKDQYPITTANTGRINPEDIDDYIAVGGYEALTKMLQITPPEVIDLITKSKLRGKGGAGFPTGMKWGFLAKETNTPKYLICNGDEGDPGAFMDRTILESDPQAVVEGMIIGAWATGASQGFVYTRAEKPLAAKRIGIAVQQAQERGYLGTNILGSGLDFDIQLRRGAGAFVCGEETALMASIMGGRGNPRPRPPFPAQSGLWGKPTNVNNVKSWATIPKIIQMGVENYAKMGTEDSSGTAIFCLTGKINNSGLVEIPMGTTIRTLVYEIGEGCPNNKQFKAIQIGGPSGGCIPAKFLDMPIDFKHINDTGAIFGSGGIIVLDEDTCMVELAHFFIDFTQKESCGKCTPCRLGTLKMREILEKISNGKATLDDLTKLETIANTVSKTSLCALGGTAPNPVLTTLKYFRSEYEAHLRGECPALVCKALIHYSINPKKCIGCGLCKRNCSAQAITGEMKSPHSINWDLCVKCGMCISACNKDAIYKTTGGNKIGSN